MDIGREERMAAKVILVKAKGALTTVMLVMTERKEGKKERKGEDDLYLQFLCECCREDESGKL